MPSSHSDSLIQYPLMDVFDISKQAERALLQRIALWLVLLGTTLMGVVATLFLFSQKNPSGPDRLINTTAAGYTQTAKTDSWRFYVEANQLKRDGRPWDGRNDITPFFDIPGGAIGGPLLRESPPDLKIGVLTTDSQFHVLEGANCRNSYRCEFEDFAVPTDAFGILIVDVDVKYHDYVDALIIVPPDSHPDQRTLDQIKNGLRQQIAKHVKPNPYTAMFDRLAKPDDSIPIKVLDRCALDNPCRLGQSDVWFTTATYRHGTEQDYQP